MEADTGHAPNAFCAYERTARAEGNAPKNNKSLTMHGEALINVF
jgi:hypothetical protein